MNKLPIPILLLLLFFKWGRYHCLDLECPGPKLEDLGGAHIKDIKGSEFKRGGIESELRTTQYGCF